MRNILFFLLLSLNCLSQTKAVLKATVANNIVTLDITGSVFDDKPGVQGTYYFTVLGPSVQILPDNSGFKGDGKVRTFKAVAGTYKIFLNIQGSYGTKDITAVDVVVPSVTVPPVIIPPVVVPAAKDTFEVLTLYDKGAFMVKIIVFTDKTVVTSKIP